MANVAEAIVETLIAAKVRRIYGLVGDSLNALTDALRRSGQIEWIGVRHEEVAAFAAGADAHLTGELAVCAGSCGGKHALINGLYDCHRSCGPGNMHLINGLYDCHRSRVPVLALAAQIPSAELGTNYFQETQARHPVQGLQPFLRAGDPAGADSAPVADRDPHRARTAGCVRVDDLRRRRAARSSGRGAGAGGRVGVFAERSRRRAAPRRRRAREAGPTADRRRQENNDPGRGGLRRRARPAGRDGGGAGSADRARAPRKGARRIRKPLRHRHDRPARIRVGLLRDDGLQPAADAGDGFSVSAVLSAARR